MTPDAIQAAVVSGPTARALIIAAPRSGAGKTTVTIGLLRALARRGLRMRGAKSGPDYIDPGFHAAATGAPGINLDSWAMPPELLAALSGEVTRQADLVLVESAMGLFDGIPGEAGRSGAAADLARLFALPVLLVLDVAGQSQSAAAIARGFATFDPGVRIGGVLLNRVGSDRHHRLIADAIAATGLPVVGAIPRMSELAMPERHLGLVQAGEHADLQRRLDALADLVEKHVDLDLVVALAAPPAFGKATTENLPPPPAQRIALAQDAAFSFVYPHLLAHWRRSGAEILAFSPLADEGPDASADVCWLPGGYPELHAGALAAAHRFRDGVVHFAQSRSVHGECGGYMVLGESIEDAQGERHRMLGLLSHSTSFAQRRMHLGYRAARLLADSPLGVAGTQLRGHEFHYATLLNAGSDAPFANLSDGEGRALGPSGGRREKVSGSFFHVIASV